MWPGAIHEGNGKLAVFIDGTEEQGAAMVPILMAEDPGLPWEILAATMSEVHGPFFETIELDDNRMESHIKVGDKLDVKLETFKNPVNGEVHEPHMVLKDGFIFQDGLIGTSSANRVDADGVAFDHAGNNSYYAEVEWSSENRMAPAVPAS
jgi:hypothetical protein